jgi:cytidyltransferase-like protein
MSRVVLTTGGFDPLHSGHIEYFKAAKQLGNRLVVGLNSDKWLINKKGRPFMSWGERAAIIRELKVVDNVIDFNDDDGSANFAIYKCLQQYPDNKIIFANGGDRINENTPEYKVYGNTPWVEFAWGVGGLDKKNSSSWILEKWVTQKTDRSWGYWKVLDDKGTVKVKELVINPGASLSDQRHVYRNERWYILKGSCSIQTEWNGLKNKVTLNENDNYVIEKNVWHLTTNYGNDPCHVLEIQYGEKCVEEDIERRN